MAHRDLSRPHLSRRTFLALTGGAVLLAACGGDDGDSAGADDGHADDGHADDGHDHEHTGEGDQTGTRADIGDFTNAQAGVMSSDLHVDPAPQRLAIAILAQEGYAAGQPARLALFDPDAPPDAEPTWIDPTFRGEGLPERRGVYTTEHVFDTPGTWRGRLDYDGELSDFFFTVNAEAAMPTPGAPAPTVPSPTVSDPRGVDPLCTLDPPCPFHERSLDALVGAGRPLVVQFSTPARCQSRYCGPVLEALIDVAPDYTADVDVVHVEIYRDSSSNDLVDTIGPDGWGLTTEPWMYAIDPGGTIVARMDGAFDASEIREMLDGLTSA